MSELVEGRDVNVELALEIVRATHTAATGMDLQIAAVVCDRAGHIVASGRMDKAPLGALPIATDKAFSSAMWQCRTGEMAEVSLPGNGDWGFANAMGGRMIVFAGGVAIRKNRELIGALGVSGALSAEDEAVCLAALVSLGLDG